MPGDSQWKITVVAQQCDEETGIGLMAWQCRLQTQVCHEEALFVHTRNPGAWQPREILPCHQNFDLCVTSRQVIPHSGMQSAPIITGAQSFVKYKELMSHFETATGEEVLRYRCSRGM